MSYGQMKSKQLASCWLIYFIHCEIYLLKGHCVKFTRKKEEFQDHNYYCRNMYLYKAENTNSGRFIKSRQLLCGEHMKKYLFF